MIESLFFYGFVTSSMLAVITSIVVKVILKRNGYFVTLFDIELSDLRNLYKLSKKEPKYYNFFYVVIMLFALPLLCFILFVIVIFMK